MIGAVQDLDDYQASAASAGLAPSAVATSMAPSAATSTHSDLLYGLNQRPPLQLSIFVALQHVLAVFVGIVTPPLIISRALKLSDADGVFLVSMALFVSGLGTILQTRRWGVVGSGLLSIQGTSFVFLGPIISLAASVVAAGGTQRESLGVVFGVCMAAAIVPILIGPFIRRASTIITPLVTGIVVTLIGLTLVEVGITSLGGGFAAKQDGTFGAAANLGLAAIVIAVIVAMNGSKRDWLRTLSVVAGLAGGYVVAWAAGKVAFATDASLPLIAWPAPFRYGLGFRAAALVPFAFLYLITAIESIGDLTATSALCAEPITGEVYFRRLRGGVMADGLTSLLAAALNSFPSTTFAQNNGVIQLTGVGSRYIGTWVGGFLIVLGLLPIVGTVVQAIPQPVLGGATIIMFGMVAVAGIKILASVDMDRRATTIVALSLGLGLGVTFVPGILSQMPPFVRDMFASGVATGGMCALLLNALLPGRRA
jgi:xanthine permease XanP